MINFGWDFQKAEAKNKFCFIDADAARLYRVAMLKERILKEEISSLRGKQLPIDRLVKELQDKIKQINVKILAC